MDNIYASVATWTKADFEAHDIKFCDTCIRDLTANCPGVMFAGVDEDGRCNCYSSKETSEKGES